MIIFPLTIMLASRTKLDKHQTLVISAMLLLATFFMVLDILRTYWSLTIPLNNTTNLILLWRVLEPIVAAMLAAVSGFADWCRIHRPASGVPDDDRSWIEISDMGKSPET